MDHTNAGSEIWDLPAEPQGLHEYSDLTPSWRSVNSKSSMNYEIRPRLLASVTRNNTHQAINKFAAKGVDSRAKTLQAHLDPDKARERPKSSSPEEEHYDSDVFVDKRRNKARQASNESRLPYSLRDRQPSHLVDDQESTDGFESSSSLDIDSEDPDSEYCDENDSDDSGDITPPPKHKRNARLKSGSVSVEKNFQYADKRSLGQIDLGPAKKKKNARYQTDHSSNSSGQASRKRKRANTKLGDLLKADFQPATSWQPSQLEMEMLDKKKALSRIVDQLPPEKRKDARKDAKLLKRATKMINLLDNGRRKWLIQIDHQSDLSSSEQATKKRRSTRDAGSWKLKFFLSNLHQHQVMGLGWMCERESLINIEDDFAGGLLAAEMGLGKTVMTLALVTASKLQQTGRKKKTQQTLIVCPSNLQSQWSKETQRFCDADHVSLAHYHRERKVISFGSKGSDEQSFQRFEIVLTTYNQVIKSWKAKVSGIEKNSFYLHCVDWYRIVIDESQSLRNHKSDISQAIAALCGDRRWCLSATPIYNCPGELFPYFRFFKSEPTLTFRDFKKRLKSNPDAITEVLNRIIYRPRHKHEILGRPIVSLPPSHCITFKVEPHYIEKKVYEFVRDLLVVSLNRDLDSDMEIDFPKVKNALHILRQLTFSPFSFSGLFEKIAKENAKRLLSLVNTLVKDKNFAIKSLEDKFYEIQVEIQRLSHEKRANNSDSDISAFTKNMKLQRLNNGQGLSYNIHDFLPIWGAEPGGCECVHGCKNTDNELLWLKCGHFSCTACLFESAPPIENCPNCGKPHKPVLPLLKVELHSNSNDGKSQLQESRLNLSKNKYWPSTKILAVKALLQIWAAENPSVKVVIFGYFINKFLESLCLDEGWGAQWLTGATNPKNREKSIEQFGQCKGPCVLLSTLHAGGLGLNLTMASRVINLESWWNKAVDQQSHARIVRIGQEQETFRVKLVCKDTIDEYMEEIQEWKQKSIDRFMERNSADQNKYNLHELLECLGDVVENERGHWQIVSKKRKGSDQAGF